MNQETVQRIELAVGCILFGLVVIRFSQKRRISFRYTVGWLVLCGLGIFASLLIPVFTPIAEFLKLSPTVFLIAVASSATATIPGANRSHLPPKPASCAKARSETQSWGPKN